MKCNKTRFNDQASADYFLNKLRKTSKRKKIPQQSYLCPICNSWHLTSQPLGEMDVSPSQKNKYENIISNLNAQIENLKRAINSRDKRLEAKEKEVEILYDKIRSLNRDIGRMQKQLLNNNQ